MLSWHLLNTPALFSSVLVIVAGVSRPIIQTLTITNNNLPLQPAVVMVSLLPHSPLVHDATHHLAFFVLFIFFYKLFLFLLLLLMFQSSLPHSTIHCFWNYYLHGPTIQDFPVNPVMEPC